MNVYVALTKDALIITNDANLVNNNLEGFKGDNAIAKTLQKEMKAHNLYSKVYTNSLLQQIKANYMKGDAPSEFNEMLAQLGDMEIIDTKPTDTDYTVNASMKLNNQSENALEIILKMMQRL